MNITIYNTEIRQDENGRYCLNDLHKASGGANAHQPGKWLMLKQTQGLLDELNDEISVTRNPVTEQNQSVVIYQGADKQWQGTFVIKELVYSYAMWISPRFHLEVIKAYDRLIAQPKRAFSTPLEDTMFFFEKVAKMLNYSDTSKLKYLDNIARHHQLPTNLLPVYVDEPLTKALQTLLSENKSGLTSKRANLILETLGLIKKMERRTSNGKMREFWSVTDAGLKFGKNEIYAQHPSETQPRWYVNKFPELFTLISSQLPSNVIPMERSA